MFFNPGGIYHIYNRGNNKNILFRDDESYLLFLNNIQKQVKPFSDILAWTLMPNHFHLMLHANEKSIAPRLSGNNKIQELAYRIGILLSSYSQTINWKNGTTGSLFQQKTKARSLFTADALRNWNTSQNHYIINCMHYIHQNAWRAGLVRRIEDWKYSSFPDYSGLRNGTLCNKKTLIDLTGYDLTTFYKDSYEIIKDFKL